MRQFDPRSGLLDTTHALILVVGPDRQILRMNRHLENLCGFKEEELKGRCVIDALAPVEYADQASAHLQAFASHRS